MRLFTEMLQETMNDTFDVVEANIQTLRDALDSYKITAVDLAVEYLLRVSRYDCNGPVLNAIPILNPNLFEEAAASDERRLHGKTSGRLDGIPYTVKDSFKVKGMTVANGSPELTDLIANEDAALVQKLRVAGCVLMGRTNMPPMAYGGMQRGLSGRAENPYNLDYLAAAFASGSSNGSAASTAASFAAFGLGTETVSSGRSPASNNGLTAYTPSKGYMSVRGIWPLYPTCDVPVPHTRSVDDMLELLNILTTDDPTTRGDFWRDQSFVEMPKGWADRPKDFTGIKSDQALNGKRIAVPSCYVGGAQLSHSQDVYTSPEVESLWESIVPDLEALGAEIVIVNEFPLVQIYENPTCAADLGYPDLTQLPSNWNATERGALIARTWEAFLKDNADPKLNSLRSVDVNKIFPQVAPDHPQIVYAEPANMIRWNELVDHLADPSEDAWPAIYNTQNLEQACRALEGLRKALLDDWLAKNKFDMLAFPAAGDVGRSDSDVNHESAKHAWATGVKYSHGNRALRHIGVPSVTVTMGTLASNGIPIGITFAGRAYSDVQLLSCAKAFEASKNRRVVPKLTPRLSFDRSRRGRPQVRPLGRAPLFEIYPVLCSSTGDLQTQRLHVRGQVASTDDSFVGDLLPIVEIYIDSIQVPEDQIKIEADITAQRYWTFEAKVAVQAHPIRTGWNATKGQVARDRVMVVIVARLTTADGVCTLPSAWYTLLSSV